MRTQRGVSFILLLQLSLYCSSIAADDQSEIISRFQSYLRIDTAHPNPDYHAAADFINAQAKSLSLESQTIEFVVGKPLVLLKWPGKRRDLPSILLNSHTDVVPAEHGKWSLHPFGAEVDASGRIFARGSQDMKCVGMQYLEAIRKLKSSGFEPVRDVYLSFVPDEEIGGHDGAEKLAHSDLFKQLNVGIVLDEAFPINSRQFSGDSGTSFPHGIRAFITGSHILNLTGKWLEVWKSCSEPHGV